jgi:hypothetical protein
VAFYGRNAAFIGKNLFFDSLGASPNRPRHAEFAVSGSGAKSAFPLREHMRLATTRSRASAEKA